MALILNRNPREVICIGEDIKIIVLRVNGNSVSIGVEAPDGISIDRQEVRDSKAREVKEGLW